MPSHSDSRRHSEIAQMIRNEPVTNPRRVRVLGIMMLLLGAGMLWWQYGVFAYHDTIDLRIGFLGPFFLCLSLWLVLEAPSFPPQRYTRLGLILLTLGIISGLANALWLKLHTVPVRSSGVSTRWNHASAESALRFVRAKPPNPSLQRTHFVRR